MEAILKTTEGRILTALIPVSVIVGTILSILVYNALGGYTLFSIIGGAVIASIIIFLFIRSKQS